VAPKATKKAKGAGKPKPAQRRVRIGITGLDEVLGGGFPINHVYLVDGDPGTGKTTVGMQFLIEGRDLGERVMYVTLSETAEELRGTAESHGWSLDGIDIFELSAAGPTPAEDTYTLFHPSEVELQETVETVLDAIRKTSPTRVVIDSLSEMRLLAREPLRFRRQILALKQFFVGRNCTVLFLDDRTAPDGDMQLHSLAHGVLLLDHLAIDYGSERRRLQVKKLRGANFRGGYHDFRIQTGGVVVYPRLLTGETGQMAGDEPVTSGSTELDALLGGGLSLGTSTLVTGAAGTGKSVLCLQYALAAATRGERVHFYLFDERAATFRARARGLGMNLREAEASGNLIVRQIEPTQMSPGEFAHEIQMAVERDRMDMVVIDSINGYMQAMPSERLLGVQVHEVLSYLANNQVTSLLTLVQHGVFGGPVDEAAEISYLSDTVVLLRYFEHQGGVRQAMSVVKKRSGAHEHTIREFRIARGGVRVGEPLTQFRGVLTGVPEYRGEGEPLMRTPVPERKRKRPPARQIRV
jgi:circadian clock protein KaiC